MPLQPIVYQDLVVEFLKSHVFSEPPWSHLLGSSPVQNYGYALGFIRPALIFAAIVIIFLLCLKASNNKLDGGL
jgi:hypothetical protein